MPFATFGSLSPRSAQTAVSSSVLIPVLRANSLMTTPQSSSTTATSVAYAVLAGGATFFTARPVDVAMHLL